MFNWAAKNVLCIQSEHTFRRTEHGQFMTPPKTTNCPLYTSVCVQIKQTRYHLIISELYRCWYLNFEQSQACSVPVFMLS